MGGQGSGRHKTVFKNPPFNKTVYKNYKFYRKDFMTINPKQHWGRSEKKGIAQYAINKVRRYGF